VVESEGLDTHRLGAAQRPWALVAALEEEDGHVDAFFGRERHQGSVVYA